MHSAAQHAQGNLRSIVNMLLAVMFFSLMDAVLKTLSAHYPPLQMACLRGLTALPLVLVLNEVRGDRFDLLAESGLPIIAADTMAEAATKIVAAVK